VTHSTPAQALHIPNGDQYQSLTVAGIRLPMRPVEIDGRTFMVPRYISRQKGDRRWVLRLKLDDMLIGNESFADGTYLGLTGKSLTHAIARLIELIEQHVFDERNEA
jgi:hypothetical protein